MALTSSYPINLSDIEAETGTSSLHAAGGVAGFQGGGTHMSEFLGWSNIPQSVHLLERYGSQANLTHIQYSNSHNVTYNPKTGSQTYHQWVSQSRTYDRTVDIICWDVEAVTGHPVDTWSHIEIRGSSSHCGYVDAAVIASIQAGNGSLYWAHLSTILDIRRFDHSSLSYSFYSADLTALSNWNDGTRNRYLHVGFMHDTNYSNQIETYNLMDVRLYNP